MEVRKVNGFFIIFVIGYIGLSVVCASIMAYAQNSGIAVPDWIQYVMSEGIILLIAIIYMIVQKIDPIREIPYKRIGIVDVILSLVAGSGNNQEVLDQIVEGFNASQDQYVVVAENQGSYDESTGKFFNMANGAGSAHIIQIGEQNLQSMIDSGMIASISDLIEKYDFDDSDLLEQVVNFYTVNDTLYVMPFNCSSPVVYYNKGVFDAAGYTEFPSTFEGISEAAAAIAAQNDSITPVGMYAYGYALDQMVTNMGGYIINNENGRASRATEVSYQDQITQIYDWIKSLQDAGYLLNYGTDGTNTISGFTQQQIGMFIASSASARNVIDSSEFEVGIAPHL